MKLNKITLALAVMVSAPAAFALTPGQIDSTTIRLWLSGASAPTAAVYKGVLSLCRGVQYKNSLGVTLTNPGVVDAHIYQECGNTSSVLPGGSCSSSGGNNASNDRMAYSCTVETQDGRAGALEGQKVVIYHTVEGGSFNYVTPHIAIAGETNAVNPNVPLNLKRLSNLETLGSACAPGNGSQENVDISGLGNTVGVYRNCATTTQTFTAGQAIRADVFAAPDRPEGGFSDTEYAINQQNLNVATDISAIGSEVSTNIGQAFGVGVSYPLYYQLQLNDVTAGVIAATCTSSGTAVLPNLTASCQPGFAASKYTTIASADNIGSVDGKHFGATSATPPGTPSKIVLARRAITSGTQSASNIRFLNKPCATGTSQGALNPASVSAGNVTVLLGSSTGSVKTALTNASTAGQFGLGVVSMENTPNTATEKYAFVKLDGVSPNSDSFQRANAINGNYNFWYELVAFTATTAFPQGIDLIGSVNASLGNPNITNLKGLFITPVAGVSGANVSSSARAGNSCAPAL